MLVCVLSTKVDIPGEFGLWLILKPLLAVECSADTFGPELHFNVHAVIHDDVEGVLELLDFISRAYDSDLPFLLGLDDAVAFNHLPNGVLVLGEGGVLSVNLADVGDREFLTLVFEYVNRSEIELLSVELDIRTARRSQNQHHYGNIVTVELDDEVCADWAQNLCLKLHVHDLSTMRLDDPTPHVDVIGSDTLRLVILRLDLEPSPQIVLVDDLNLLGLGVLEEAVIEL